MLNLSGYNLLSCLEKSCPGGQVYKDCGSACPRTCPAINYGMDEDCPDTCVSGCQCPDNLYLDIGGDKCVPVEECSCVVNRKIYRPGDMIMKDCNKW